MKRLRYSSLREEKTFTPHGSSIYICDMDFCAVNTVYARCMINLDLVKLLLLAISLSDSMVPLYGE